MSEKVMPGPVQDNTCIREAVCIHTKKIYDSCKEEDIASYIKLYSAYTSRLAESSPWPSCSPA